MTTDHQDPFETVVRLLRTVCVRRFEGVSPATVLSDLPGMDSLRLLETIALAEEQFGVEIDTRRIETITTVADIVAALTNRPI